MSVYEPESFSEREAARYEAGLFTETEHQLLAVARARTVRSYNPMTYDVQHVPAPHSSATSALTRPARRDHMQQKEREKMTISEYDDIIDSRDVIERIEELEGTPWASIPREEYDDLKAELDALKALTEEAEGYAPDWKYGEVLIRDSYFTTYAQELADDIGAIDANASWPLTHIDWQAAADELKMDYASVEFNGVTYWVR